MCSVTKYLAQSPIVRSHLGASPLCAGPLRPLIIEDCQVGFPIRTSRDQRVLSPPPGLSQSATSFIASCCQGIHQTPLSRLIRSRRRQALLREAGSTSTRRPSSGRKSLTRAHPLGRERAGREPRTTLRSDEAHGQCHLTWKDCLQCPTASGCLRTFILEPPDARTCPFPTWNGPEDVSCIALFTMSVCRTSPSGPCQYLAVSLARSDRKAHHG